MKLTRHISAALLAFMMVFTMVIGSGIIASATTTNVALNKEYSIYYLDASNNEVTVQSTRGYSAKLTDGQAAVLDPFNPSAGVGAWFALFTNAEAVDKPDTDIYEGENCPTGVANVAIDLGEVYGITDIKMNVSNNTGDNTAPKKIAVYGKETAEGEYTYLGDLTAPTATYGEAVLTGLTVNARYIKYEISVNEHWALFNEIVIMGGTAFENPTNPPVVNPDPEDPSNGANIAFGKTYKTYYLDAEGVEQAVNATTRGYTASLTDGLAVQEAPKYGVDGAELGNWFAFFMNAEAVEKEETPYPDGQNCASGVGYIDLDLGAVYSLSEIKMNLSNIKGDNGTAPRRVRVYASVTGSDEYLRIGDLSGATGDYGWASIDAGKFTAQYLRFEVTHQYHWAHFNEIEVYGTAATYIPASSENGAYKADYITYHIVDGNPTDINKISRNYGASLTDGIYDINEPITDENYCNDGKWFGFFDNDLNETVAAIQNCPNGVGYVKIDMGEVYNITDIVINTSIKANKPESIKAYASLTENGEYTEIGSLTLGTGDSYAAWAVLKPESEIQGQFIILEVTVDGYWALFNEVQVYGSSRVASEGSNVALGADVLVEEAPNRPWHVTDLTDGIAVDEMIPGTGTDDGWKEGEKSGWLGFFAHEDPSVPENTEDNVGVAIINFGCKVTLNDILVHIYGLEGRDYGGVMAPARISAYIADSVDGPYTYVGDCTFIDGYYKAAYWAEINDINVTGRFLKLEVEVHEDAYWAMINEVEAFGIKHPEEEKPEKPGEIVTTETRLHGDLNNDGLIDKLDYTLLKRHCFDTYPIEENTIEFLVADIDNNGVIDKMDYTYLKRFCFDTYVIAPEYVEFKQTITDVTTVTIASFNIAHVNQYNFTQENYQALANDIKSSNADIVGIQEAVCGIFSKGTANERFTDSLAKLKSLTGYKYAYYLGWDDATNVAHGILSNYEITNLGEGTLIEASIESLTTANDHYYSVTEFNSVDNYSVSNASGATLLEFDINGTTISFWNAHSKPANYATDLAIVDGDEENFILVGDFNNPAYSDLTDFEVAEGVTLGSYMSLVNNEDNKLITFPRDEKFMDNIIYTTDDFLLLDSGVVVNSVLASDHRLIWAEFAIIPEVVE